MNERAMNKLYEAGMRQFTELTSRRLASLNQHTAAEREFAKQAPRFRYLTQYRLWILNLRGAPV